MKIEGGCYCGEVRYSFEGEPGPHKKETIFVNDNELGGNSIEL